MYVPEEHPQCFKFTSRLPWGVYEGVQEVEKAYDEVCCEGAQLLLEICVVWRGMGCGGGWGESQGGMQRGGYWGMCLLMCLCSVYATYLCYHLVWFGTAVVLARVGFRFAPVAPMYR